MTITKKGIWIRGLIAALVSGVAGGILNGLAAIGISPDHFNFQEPAMLIKMTVASAIVTGVIGVAGYLQKSPLPDSDE